MKEYIIKLERLKDYKVIILTKMMSDAEYEILKNSIGKYCSIKGVKLKLTEVFPRDFKINVQSFS